MKEASTRLGQGIAGAVAQESDLIAGDCQMCPLNAGRFDVWPAPAAIRDAAAGCAVVASGPPPVTFDVDGRYQHALDPGEYLVCMQRYDRPCIGVTVAAGRVTTLNVKEVAGPARMAVLDPGSVAFRLDGFSCSDPGS